MSDVVGKSQAFWQGFRAGAPFILVIVPFAMLFGVVGTEAGLNLAQVMGFTVLVIAGAAQFTAVQLMTENAPTVIVLISALAVNLRMAMYSASMAPHIGKAGTPWKMLAAYFMVDQSYAVSVARYENAPPLSLGEKLAYFFGSITPIAPLWYAGTLLGALAGARIPPEYALDFALPITFLALIVPALRSAAHVAAAVTAALLSLVFVGLPLNLGLLVAAAIGMLVGAEIERRVARRQA